jgi:hypothetical protein
VRSCRLLLRVHDARAANRRPGGPRRSDGAGGSVNGGGSPSASSVASWSRNGVGSRPRNAAYSRRNNRVYASPESSSKRSVSSALRYRLPIIVAASTSTSSSPWARRASRRL